MNKKQAVEIFKNDHLKAIRKQYGFNDTVAIRSAWNDFVDQLEKEGSITAQQSYSWSNPF